MSDLCLKKITIDGPVHARCTMTKEHGGICRDPLKPLIRHQPMKGGKVGFAYMWMLLHPEAIMLVPDKRRKMELQTKFPKIKRRIKVTEDYEKENQG